jgi:hypothetical protein
VDQYGRPRDGATLVVRGRFVTQRLVRGSLVYIGANRCRLRISFLARLRPDPVRAPGHWCSMVEITDQRGLRPIVADATCADARKVVRAWAQRPRCRRRECRVAGRRCRPVFSGWFDPTSTTSCTGGGNRGTVEIAVLRHCGEVLNRLYMTAINLRCRSMHRLSSSLGCPGYRAGRRCRNRAFNCEITRHWLDDSVDYRCAHVTRPREAVELFYRAPL